jgi:hypothetical protein
MMEKGKDLEAEAMNVAILQVAISLCVVGIEQAHQTPTTARPGTKIIDLALFIIIFILLIFLCSIKEGPFSFEFFNISRY